VDGSEIIPSCACSMAGGRNRCVHGNNRVIVEELLDMHPYKYFTASHTPVGFLTALFMTYRFQQVAENKTHFTLTFKAKVPYVPEWFKKQFCLFILRTQVFKLWKLESINELIKKANASPVPI